MGERKTVAVGPIVYRQQPTTEPLLDRVQRIAADPQGQLREQNVQVTKQHLMQLAVAVDQVVECLSPYPEGFAGHLNYAPGTRGGKTQEDGQANHTFAAYHSYLDSLFAAIAWKKQGQHTVSGKVNVTDGLTRFMQNRPQGEGNPFEVREKTVVFAAR